jgi:hypothetical protein
MYLLWVSISTAFAPAAATGIKDYQNYNLSVTFSLARLDVVENS